MCLEFIGGYIANSIAIMSDAAHLLSDFMAFLISMLSICLGSWPATKMLSYGYHRFEVIGAILSVFIIWGLTTALVYEAIDRIINTHEVDGLIMMITAVIGLIINLSMLKVLHSTPGGTHSHCNHDHGHGHGHAHKKKKKKKDIKKIIDSQKELFQKDALLKIDDEEKSLS